MDEFAELAERHRRELHVHCYRMLASFDQAQDAVQETFLRAWRGRDGFDGSGQFRAWLYRIATNVCLDVLRSRRHVSQLASFAEVPWLQPYPDQLLDEVIPAPADEEPEQVAIRRETISLVFLAALQVLPPRQRAALIARDVLGWPAADTASILGTSVAAANSALQRARATMQQHLPQHRADWTAAGRPADERATDELAADRPATDRHVTDRHVTEGPTAQERALVAQFIEAHERCDFAAAMAIAAQDIRVTMPPQPFVFEGPESIRPLMENAASMGTWRLIPVTANRMPGAASYLLGPGDTEFRAFKFDIMRIENGAIAEITTFGSSLFPAFGLQPVLRPPASPPADISALG
jgi:RNA polymerase sigma factor (sigma-70 family)